MQVYRVESRGRHTVFVTPGAKFPSSDWAMQNGRPRMFAVAFESGRATVDNKLGEYMISEGLAQRTSLILPMQGVIA